MQQKTLTIFGSVNIDHIISVADFVKPGETLTGSNYHLAFGGKGANQAVAAARLKTAHLNVQFLGCIGNDPLGGEIHNAMQRDGIDTSAIKIATNSPTGVAFIQVASSGQNSIVIASGANALAGSSYIQSHKAVLEGSDYLLMQLETPLEAVKNAVKIAKGANVPVALNPAPASFLPDELLANLDLITPNETEAEILTGIKVIDEKTASKASEYFHAKGVNKVVITMGSRGAYASENAKGECIPAHKVQAIDTIAAGDTFSAALVVEMLSGRNLFDAVRFATAASAISVTRRGAQSSIPKRYEVENFLHE